MTPTQREALEAYERLGSYSAAARELKIDESSFRERIKRARKHAESDARYLEESGYAIGDGEKTPSQAWAEHVSAFERKVGKQSKRKDQVICRSGPFALFHATDEHIDDDGSALNVLSDDIRASHEMGAIMCHGGDLLNNWPIAGRLAKQWAEQSCTLPDALLRAQHFIDMFKPDVWVDGNHEEFNPYLVNLFETWLPKETLRDYWRCDFTVVVPGGRDLRASLSHKFQKGSSWFHGVHGHIREMLEAEERDLYLDGHYHIDAVMHHSLRERGHSALLVASAGYKMLDKWASRISRGGKSPRMSGRAHWVVVDPFSEVQLCTAFKCPQQAMHYLDGLQNLREI